jgi:hypothetical protein
MSFKRVCSALINGKRWKIGFGVSGANNDGLCNYDRQTVFIRAAHNGRTRSLDECVIHEVAHAVMPQIDEATILHLGEVCAKVLEKMRKAEASK